MPLMLVSLTGQNNTGFGDGPWVAADLENGMYYGGNVTSSTNKPLTDEFVTALLKGRVDTMALRGGNAAAGRLQTMYDGPRPPPAKHGVKPGKGYQPMQKQGAIILGIGGMSR
jgi:non-reducing end alpha-L-arabinofuranosidase